MNLCSSSNPIDLNTFVTTWLSFKTPHPFAYWVYLGEIFVQDINHWNKHPNRSAMDSQSDFSWTFRKWLMFRTEFVITWRLTFDTQLCGFINCIVVSITIFEGCSGKDLAKSCVDFQIVRSSNMSVVNLYYFEIM